MRAHKMKWIYKTFGAKYLFLFLCSMRKNHANIVSLISSCVAYLKEGEFIKDKNVCSLGYASLPLATVYVINNKSVFFFPSFERVLYLFV